MGGKFFINWGVSNNQGVKDFSEFYVNWAGYKLMEIDDKQVQFELDPPILNLRLTFIQTNVI